MEIARQTRCVKTAIRGSPEVTHQRIAFMLVVTMGKVLSQPWMVCILFREGK